MVSVMKYAPYIYKGNDVILETLRLGNGKRSWSATILSQTSWSSWDCPTEHEVNSEPEAFMAAKQSAEERVNNKTGLLDLIASRRRWAVSDLANTSRGKIWETREKI